MRSILTKLWNDDEGAIIATEFIFLASILVIGIVTGMVAVRDAVSNELVDVANAVGSVNQSYSFSGTRSSCASTAGSAFVDQSRVQSLTHSPATPLVDPGPSSCDQ
jgi:Flp pilus assembly pilin Flp